MSEDIIIKNVVLEVRLDRYNKQSHISFLVTDELIGRLLEKLSSDTNSVYIFDDRENKYIRQRSFFMELNIDDNHKVIVSDDFIPKPFPGDSEEDAKKMYIQKGTQPAYKFAGLETTCTCICDITFKNVALSEQNIPLKIKQSPIFRVTYESIDAILTSNIVLDGIGIVTGCPNWG